MPTPALHELLATVEPAFDWLTSLVQTLGLPGAAVAVIAYSARKLILWLQPWIEKGFNAYIQRQETIAASMSRLADGSLEIQQQGLNALAAHGEILRAVQSQIAHVCPYNNQHQNPAG